MHLNHYCIFSASSKTAKNRATALTEKQISIITEATSQSSEEIENLFEAFNEEFPRGTIFKKYIVEMSLRFLIFVI